MQPNRDESVVRMREFEIRLDSLVARIDQLPTLPQVLWEIIAQLQDSQNAAADLASAIEDDPSLSANVLRLVNSAYYGFSERFVSMRDAVVALGRREIERLVGATVVIDTFGATGSSAGLDYSSFWIHCLQTADAAEHISTMHYTISPFVPSEAYLAGLLHDLGKLIMSEFLPEDWERVREHADRQGRGIAVAERALLGMDHGEVAARLMEEWGFPASIVDSTRWHHRIADLPSQPNRVHPAEITALANQVTHDFARGFFPDQTHAHQHPRMFIDHRQAALLARSLGSAAKRATLLLS